MKREEKLLLIGSNIWYLGEGMLGPLFAVFAERVGGNVLDIAWAWSAYLVVTGAGMIVVGKLSDGQFSKKRLMVLGYALNAIFTFGYLLVSSPMQLLLVQTGLGLAAAFANPTWSALYAQFETRKAAGYEWGLASGQAAIVTGIAILIGGFIVTYYSFTALFVTMGVIQIIAALYQARILIRPRKGQM